MANFNTHLGVAAVGSGMLATLCLQVGFVDAKFISWLTGSFIFLGFILHLLLDEIYSVDFMGHRLKRSFGTALKLVDSKERISTMVIITGIFLIWFLTPDIHRFLDTLTSPETYRVIIQRL